MPFRIMLPALRLVVFLMVFGQPAIAQDVPPLISFQGFLTDTIGAPLDTTVGMTFTFYKLGSSTYTAGFTRSYPSVEVKNGVLNQNICCVDTVRFDQDILLGIKVGDDPEMKTFLTPAPFALGLRGLYAIESGSTVGAGDGLSYNIVGGASVNKVASNAVGGTISGGGNMKGESPNTVTASFGTVGGGEGNTADKHATVGGGTGNSAGPRSVIGGGSANAALGSRSDYHSMVIGGGSNNKTTHRYSSVVGGFFNEANGEYAAVGGGYRNVAGGRNSTVPGGQGNQALGDGSYAAGVLAKAAHDNSFVWNTSTVDTLESTGDDQFLIRAPGGVGIGTNSPLGELHVSGGNGDADLYLEADIDNVGETDNPLIRFRQDGGMVGANVGFDDSRFGSNNFGIGMRFNSLDLGAAFVMQADGDIGIGTTNPASNRLGVVSNQAGGIPGATIHAENTNTGQAIAGVFVSNGTDATLVVDNNGTGDLIKAFASGLRFRVRNNGDVNADGGYTSPATDLAEVFKVDGSASDYEPGDVLVVSTRTNRVVEKSDQAYSTRVAGVYATKPGVQLGTPIDGETIPMGVVGVIPTKVSAENGSIQRGDLLVTSSTPGHAMKAEPILVHGIEIYPTGTILGKALEPFDQVGTGMIEVLVQAQ